MPRLGFAIDDRACIGCHACTVACKSEHVVPLGVNRTWVKYIERGTFPDTERAFTVQRCNHCENAPCVTICPVTSLYQRDDGIVDFDSDRCIGCKACMQACPYDALYLDPQTNEILRTWENPWTGKTNQVLHVANDPVNQRPFYPNLGGGRTFSLPVQFNGDYWWLTSTVPLFYRNPLGGDYQPYVGGTYHATEMFNFIGDTASLTGDATDTADVAVGWVRISNWLPWMEMDSRQGLIYMHTAGRKLGSYDELPELMKREIATNYPEYDEPPPADDDRPNETSWTYFQKMVESGGFKGSAGLEADGAH